MNYLTIKELDLHTHFKTEKVAQIINSNITSRKSYIIRPKPFQGRQLSDSSFVLNKAASTLFRSRNNISFRSKIYLNIKEVKGQSRINLKIEPPKYFGFKIFSILVIAILIIVMNLIKENYSSSSVLITLYLCSGLPAWFFFLYYWNRRSLIKKIIQLLELK